MAEHLLCLQVCTPQPWWSRQTRRQTKHWPLFLARLFVAVCEPDPARFCCCVLAAVLAAVRSNPAADGRLAAMLSRRRLGAALLALCLAAAAAGAQGAAATAASAGSGSGEGEVTRIGPFAFQKQEHYHYELVFLAFVAIFIVNIYFGRARNERLAISWTSQVRRAHIDSGPLFPST